MCTWYHYPQQIQDVLDHSWQTLMLLEDWNFKIATNMSVPLNQEMIQASCFIDYFYPIVIFVTGVFWRDSMHFNRNRPPMVLDIAFMKKLNWKTRGVIYKLVIFMQRGWSGWRKTLLKHYFSTSFIPYWGFIFRGGMWLEILRLVSLIGIILDTFIIYFNISSSTYNIDAVYLVMLVFIIWYYTLSTQYCYLN